jgi:hypothetical protein
LRRRISEIELHDHGGEPQNVYSPRTRLIIITPDCAFRVIGTVDGDIEWRSSSPYRALHVSIGGRTAGKMLPMVKRRTLVSACMVSNSPPLCCHRCAFNQFYSVTLPYAAATRPSALPHVRVCDTARKKIVSRSLEPGRKILQ